VVKAKMLPVAEKLWRELESAHPEWATHQLILDSGDIEIAIPAPAGSHAGHLVLFTSHGSDLWLRFAPPQMCYSVDDASEMLQIAEGLLAERIVFVRITRDGEWAATTLGRPDEELDLETGQVGEVVSWSGRHDRIVQQR